MVTFSSYFFISPYQTTDWKTGIRSPAEAKDFSSSLCVQTSPEAISASNPIGTRFLSPGVNCGRGVTLSTHPQVELKSGISRSYISFLVSSYTQSSRTALQLYTHGSSKYTIHYQYFENVIKLKYF
jgi:hypothetical protein